MYKAYNDPLHIIFAGNLPIPRCEDISHFLPADGCELSVTEANDLKNVVEICDTHSAVTGVLMFLTALKSFAKVVLLLSVSSSGTTFFSAEALPALVPAASSGIQYCW